MPKQLFASVLILTLSYWLTIYSQEVDTSPAGTNSKQSLLIGEAKAVEVADRRLVLKTDSGTEITIVLHDRAALVQVPPGEHSLAKATPITLSEVTVGDRVLARDITTINNQILVRAVVIISREKLQLQRQQEQDDWRRRGISGVVEAIDLEKREVNLLTTATSGVKSVTVVISDQAQFRRYVENSIRPADAKLGTLADLKVGDQLQALGYRSPDGGRIAAEEVISGTFRTIGGSVININTEANEIQLRDLLTNQTLTVLIADTSLLRQVTAEIDGEFSSQWKRRGTPTAQAAASPAPNQQPRIASLSSFAITDLKPGALLLLLTASNVKSEKIIAATVLAGADGFLSLVQKEHRKSKSASGLRVELGLPFSALASGIGMQ